MPAGSGQPSVQSAEAECPEALRPYLCRDLDRLSLRRLRHRGLCPQDRGLAGLAHGAREIRARRAGADAARSATGSSRRARANSDRGSQYVSIYSALGRSWYRIFRRQCRRFLRQALAETIDALDKAEVIHRRGPWRSFEAVEFAALEWVDWFKNRRIPPSKPGNATTPCWNNPPWRHNVNQMASGKPGAVKNSGGTGAVFQMDWLGRTISFHWSRRNTRDYHCG